MLTTIGRCLQRKYDTGRHPRRIKPLRALGCTHWLAFCAGMFAAATISAVAHAQALAPGQVVGWGFNNAGQINNSRRPEQCQRHRIGHVPRDRTAQ